MFCSNCGGKVAEGVKFCSGCGSQVGAAGVSINQEKAVNIIQAQPSVMPAALSASQYQTIMADEKFCFSCGSVVKKAAEICPKCGVNQSQRNNTAAIDVYCISCGKSIKKEASICPFCGVRQGEGSGTGVKNWTTTLLLIIFTGVGHRFYVGKIGTAILMLLTMLFGYIFSIIGVEEYDEAILAIGGFIILAYAIWWIIDLISICTRKFTDKNGQPLKKT